MERTAGPRARNRTLIALGVLLLVAGATTAHGVARGALPSGDAGSVWAGLSGPRYGHAGTWVHPHPVDGWFVYSSYSCTSYDLRRVPIEALEASVAEGAPAEWKGGPRFVVEAHFAWNELPAGARTAVALVDALHEARLREEHAFRGPTPQEVEEQRSFDERFEDDVKAAFRRYPLVVAGEALWLTLWAAFLLWPWARGAGPLRRGLHLGLAPLLLVAPLALGYGSSSLRDSTDGPYLVAVHRLTSLAPGRTQPYEALPPLLEPLGRAPLNEYGVRRDSPGPDPLVLLALGATLGALPLGVGLGRGRWPWWAQGACSLLAAVPAVWLLTLFWSELPTHLLRPLRDYLLIPDRVAALGTCGLAVSLTLLILRLRGASRARRAEDGLGVPELAALPVDSSRSQLADRGRVT